MLDKIQAMSEPTRFAILQVVKGKEMPAGEIARHFKFLTRPAVSQHIQILKNNGLLSERREGAKRIYSIRGKGFLDIHKFLLGFWDSHLDKLKMLAEMEELRKCKTK